MKKRGLSNLIIISLTILISLALILILYNFVRSFIKERSEQFDELELLNVKLDIIKDSIVIDKANSRFIMNLKRDIGHGTMDGFALTIIGERGEETFIYNISLKESEIKQIHFNYDSTGDKDYQDSELYSKIGEIKQLKITPLLKKKSAGESTLIDYQNINNFNKGESQTVNIENTQNIPPASNQNTGGGVGGGGGGGGGSGGDTVGGSSTGPANVICGNNRIDIGEQCEENNLNGATCTTLLNKDKKCRGDLNEDGNVNNEDLDILNNAFLTFYGKRCSSENNWCNKADINKDGVVDSSDFFIVDQDISNACKEEVIKGTLKCNSACKFDTSECFYEISNCREIEREGFYKLSNNINSESTCIKINSRNVVLDCDKKEINITKIGSGGEITQYYYGIILNNENITIKNCKMRLKGDAIGIYLNYSNYSKIQDVLIESENNNEGATKGISLINTRRAEITDIRINKLKDHGIQISNSNENQLKNIEIKDIWEEGIDITSSNANILENIRSNNNGYNLRFYDSSDNQISGNFENCKTDYQSGCKDIKCDGSNANNDYSSCSYYTTDCS